MILTSENYFTKEASWEYSGSSQYKSFFGTLVRPGCEARALAELSGDWERPMSTALMVGSYVDAHFEGTLDLFRAQNPDIFLKGGGLKSEYRKADDIINFLEADEYFMKYMGGEKQVIMTGEIDHVPFKIKIDSWHPGRMIVDLKVMASLTKKEWVQGSGKTPWIVYWGYDIQAAIYTEIVRQNTGHRLPFFIAGASKEAVTNKEIIYIDDRAVDEAMEHVMAHIDRFKELKAGAEPVRCGKCDYCRSTKVLTAPVHYLDLEED